MPDDVDVFANGGEHYQEMIENSRDDDNKDFTALVYMLQKLHHTYYRSKDEAITIAQHEGNWTDRDIKHAADMVYDMGM